MPGIVNHYCTLFDSGYLTRGLALYDSILRSGESFRLYIFCFDDRAYELLRKLKLEHAELITLAEFETPELLRVKPTRGRGEYCWTSTSFTIQYCLDQFQLEEVTYLDADLYFFGKPSILLDELRKSNSSVLLTLHRYSADYDKSLISGKYCVQFMPFKSDSRGRAALRWWQERCLEWCYNRVEDGKFGDQKYLDDWTTRFEGVRVLEHLGGGVAPWNIQNYEAGPGPTVDGIPVIFYHFHALKWLAKGYFDLAEGYKLSAETREYIYQPYLAALKQALEQVRKVEPGFNLGKIDPKPTWMSPVRKWKRILHGNYHVVRE
jgi:hypothetical protein